MLNRSVLQNLEVLAEVAIDQALSHGSKFMSSAPSTEVGFVAALILGAMPVVADSWRNPLSSAGLQLSLHSVFCHASPQVKYRDACNVEQGCELADLLIVIDMVTKGVAIRRASLIQSKMACNAGEVHFSGKSSKVQLDLYQTWPDFNFVANAFPKKHFNFRIGGVSTASGTIGVINRHLKKSTTPKWTQHKVLPTPRAINGSPNLAQFLTWMVEGSHADYWRSVSQQPCNDWNEVIELLLNITYNKTFRHSATFGAARQQRGNTTAAYLFYPNKTNPSPLTVAAMIPPSNRFEIVDDEGDPVGISMVHLVVSDEDFRTA